MKISAKDVYSRYIGLINDSEARDYLHVHSKRFAFLINLIKQQRSLESAQNIRILDIGPSFLSDLLRKEFEDSTLYTLGFTHEASRGGHLPEFIELESDKFISFDLNHSDNPDAYPQAEPFDLIVMGEVLEHLHTSPVHVFRFLKTLLKPGGLLIVGTPNAVALERRITLLAGKNPYEIIRLNKHNPGHFREYTVEELKMLGKEAGLDLIDHQIANYFIRYSWKGKLFDFLTSLLPSSFRTGIHVVYKNS
jgi:SAM-dependent methyltransferase